MLSLDFQAQTFMRSKIVLFPDCAVSAPHFVQHSQLLFPSIFFSLSSFEQTNNLISRVHLQFTFVYCIIWRCLYLCFHLFFFSVVIGFWLLLSAVPNPIDYSLWQKILQQSNFHQRFFWRIFVCSIFCFCCCSTHVHTQKELQRMMENSIESIRSFCSVNFVWSDENGKVLDIKLDIEHRWSRQQNPFLFSLLEWNSYLHWTSLLSGESSQCTENICEFLLWL